MIHPTQPFSGASRRFTPARGPRNSVSTTETPRRVRHQAREAVVLMAFSAMVSVAFALALLVVTRLGSQG